jgi:lysozyme family protein
MRRSRPNRGFTLVELLGQCCDFGILVKAFFRTHFWNPVKGDEITNQHIANKVFDTAVNQGIGSSIRYLQESLNLLNRNRRDYPDLEIDGRMGPATLKTIERFLELEQDRPDYLLKLLNLLQALRYLEIMRRDPTQERFARGWLNRVELQ